MARFDRNREQTELGIAVSRYKTAFITVALLSSALNILLLGGSIYMMLIYDSVLPSHSLPTLFGLLVMVTVVYLFQGVFENMRSRILGDVANALDNQLSPRVQSLITRATLMGQRFPGDGLTPMRDLEQVRGFLSGAGPATLIDLPWILFFLAVLFLLHYWLGVTATVGAIVMLALTWLTNRSSKEPTAQVTQIAAFRNGMAENNLRHAEVLAALGMQGRMTARWEAVNQLYLTAQNKLSRTVATYGGASKVFRMFLQSIILTVGALLVIDGKASGGVIFASSILSGRALAPVDQAIANWRGLASARLGWRRLNELLAHMPEGPDIRTILPAPQQELAVQQLVLAPPGKQTIVVQGVDFTLPAGTALGIVGPSAAGKSSLARAIVGTWRPARGSIRLDGATLDQWDADALGASLGYLPQSVELLEGTIAENIARFTDEPDSQMIIAAAKAANVHEMIVAMPQGYDTPVGMDGEGLSSGQRQRIGLARALFGDPFLVVLDEPNSNLDAEGEAALERAIVSVRDRGGIVIIIAHRPSALAQVNLILYLREGRQVAFGPRDEVLDRIVSKPVAALKSQANDTDVAPDAKEA